MTEEPSVSSESSKKAKAEAGRKGGVMGKLIPVVLASAVGLGSGAFFLGGNSGGAAGAVGETTTTLPGPVVALAPVTLNMADGRYLKVGVALQLAHDYEPAGGGGGHGAPEEEDPTSTWASALDTVINVLGGRTYDQLVDPEDRRQAKAELLEALHQLHGEDVEDVYFTEFVMQ